MKKLSDFFRDDLKKQLSVEEVQQQYTPEDAALLMRSRIFIRLRWFAIIGVVITTLVASKWLRIDFPVLPVYLTCAFMALYNLAILYQTRRVKAVTTDSVKRGIRTYGLINVFLDLITLTVLIHFTGGIENPFIFFFVFHVIIASIALHYRTVYYLATSALIMVILMVGLEYFGIIPHVNLEGFASPTLYQDGIHILIIVVALATVLYASTYMSTAVSGELRKRQRQIVVLNERILQQRTDELEQASKEMTKLQEEKKQFVRFLGVAAHDLKAPLAAIQSYFEVMLGGFSGPITAKQKHMLERSSLRIKGLLDLISDLLDIPHIEAGLLVQEMEEVSLRSVINQSIADLRNLAKQKGIKLKAELPLAIPKVYGSTPRLQQVMINLVSNAINYTDKGTIIIRVVKGDNAIKVEVMDTGIGISPEDLPMIFGDFFRASNVDPNTETKGTGLGLSITKRIVEAHGGRIWAESPCSETGVGARFTFALQVIQSKGKGMVH